MATPAQIELQKLKTLLRQEFIYERDEYERSLLVDHLGGKVQESNCRYPISVGRNYYNTLDQITVDIAFDYSADETETDFEPGQPVVFFYVGNEHTEWVNGEPVYDRNRLKELPFQAQVDSVGSGSMKIVLPNRSALNSLIDYNQTKLLGIKLCLDTTSYRIMDEALTAAMTIDNSHFVHLREVLIGNQKPQFHTQLSVSIPWLNASQQAAVQKVIEAKDVAIVHGPPGTGKTTTLIEAIIETLHRETQVMVCAPSNAAIDWISEQLARRGVAVLRVGNPLRMSDEMLECSYERRYAAHPDYGELWSIRKLLHQKNTPEAQSALKPAKRQQLTTRANELENRINQDIFNQARVVACTLIGSAYKVLDHRHFSTLFIDEAAQGLEPACWVPIVKCDRVVLSGDHQQLPPTIHCVEAARAGLSTTLMQKVAKTKPECVKLLDIQYRMHQDIMEFSSQWFYGGRLKAAPEVAQRLVSLMDSPLTWIDTSKCDFEERNNTNTMSRMNSKEAQLLIHSLKDYIDMIGIDRIKEDLIDFGIISPYKAQVRLLRKLIRRQPFFKALRGRIRINSVDGFQGQECDVIILSMVRDNDKGSIGFLNDLRRMNVAITRAKMKLIVVGNTTTLSRHRFYRELIDYFDSKDAIVQAVTETPNEDSSSLSE